METQENYTSLGVKVLNRQERDALRKSPQLFSKYNGLWDSHKMNATKTVGRVMDIVVQSRAKTQKEFQAYYLENYHAWEEVETWGQKWATLSGLPEDIALAHVIVHIFDQTWDGFQKEEEVIYWMNRHPDSPHAGRAFRPDYLWDKNHAIDIAIRDYDAEHGFVDCYQVKPASFFRDKKIGWAKEKISKDHRSAEALGLKPMLVNLEDITKRGKLLPKHWSEIVQ